MAKVYLKRDAGASSSFPFFEHFHALCDRIGELTPCERSVCTLMLKYADRRGHAYPAATTLARKSGVSLRHVRRVLRSLSDKGLIKTVARHSGHRRSALRCVMFIQANARQRSRTVGGAEHPCQPEHLNDDLARPATVTSDVTQTPQRNSPTSPTSDNGQFEPPNAGLLSSTTDGGDGGDEHLRRLVEALMDAGVLPQVARKLATKPGLRVAEVRVVQADSAGKRNPGAWVTAVIQKDGYRRGADPLDAKLAAWLVNGGYVRRVAETAVTGCVAKHNRDLYLTRKGEEGPFKVIPADQLRMDIFE